MRARARLAVPVATAAGTWWATLLFSFDFQVSTVVFFFPVNTYLVFRGTIVNGTYGTHKNLHISQFLPAIFDPIYCGPPW